ncbi:FixJ family two-component response regulator [Oxalobacteraceae bacterium GrIS 2.11]
MPRVFILDDQTAVLKAVSRLLELSGFRTMSFTSPKEFLASGSTQLPGCLVLDLTMPDMNGIAVVEEMSRVGSKLPVIFLTGNGNVDNAVMAMKLGALDFLTKPVNKDKLVAAVSCAFEKNRIAIRQDAQHSETRQRLCELTARELEVIKLVAAGKLNKQAADELGIAEQTVKIHRARAMSKLQVRSVAELVHLMQTIAE